MKRRMTFLAVLLVTVFIGIAFGSPPANSSPIFRENTASARTENHFVRADAAPVQNTPDYGEQSTAKAPTATTSFDFRRELERNKKAPNMTRSFTEHQQAKRAPGWRDTNLKPPAGR